MLFYRTELKTKFSRKDFAIGPYRHSGYSYKSKFGKHGVTKPNIYRDGKLYSSLLKKSDNGILNLEQYYFGFNSIDQIKNWWDDDRAIKWLIKKGYVIRVYDVPEIIKGKTQVLVHKDAPKKVKRIIKLERFLTKKPKKA